MEKLIAIDSNYVRQLREKIQQQWEQEQAALVKKAQQEIDDKKKELHAVEEQIGRESERVALAKQNLDETEKAVVETLQLKEDVEKQIYERLQAISEDRASALVESAFIHAAVAPQKDVDRVDNSVQKEYQIDLPLGTSDTQMSLKEALPDILEACAELCGEDDLIRQWLQLHLWQYILLLCSA